jgi:hypothetical protein
MAATCLLNGTTGMAAELVAKEESALQLPSPLLIFASENSLERISEENQSSTHAAQNLSWAKL